MRSDVIQSGAIRLNSVGGTAKLQEARAKTRKRRSGSRICAIDGSGAKRHTGVGNISQGEQSVAKSEISLIRRSVGGIAGCRRKCLNGSVQVSCSRKRLTLIRQKCALFSVGSVLKRIGICRCSVSIHSKPHQTVTTEVIGFTEQLAGLLGGKKHARSCRKITSTIRCTCLFKILSVHYCSLWTMSMWTISSPARSAAITFLPSRV